MPKYVIVSRHPAAVQFIREALPEFSAAPVVETASADDVRGAVVAGNLPLHLAAICSQVIAVEFDGAPPRGAEYGIEDMCAAGARLTRYIVSAVAQPQPEIRYSDGVGSRGRQTRLLVGKGDTIAEWTGDTICGVAAAKSADYTKNGKWSHTQYTIALAAGAWHYVARQSWEEGEYFHGCNSVGDAVMELRRAGCQAPDVAVEDFLRREFPRTCERLDLRSAGLSSLS